MDYLSLSVSMKLFVKREAVADLLQVRLHQIGLGGTLIAWKDELQAFAANE